MTLHEAFAEIVLQLIKEFVEMSTGITLTPTEIILENDWITYILSTSGQSKALRINASGINLVPPAPEKFATCRTETGGVTTYHQSKRIEFSPSPSSDEGNLTVTFTGGIKILLTVKTFPAYILFKVLEVTQIPAGQELLELNFIKLHLIGDDHSPIIGAVYSHDFVVTTTVLCPQIDANSAEASGQYVSSAVYKAPEELTTAQAVLWGTPKDHWMELMSDLEIQFNLPHPLVGHIWMKCHHKLKASYLFVNLNADYVDDVIDIAQKAGIEYILIRGYSWCKSAGSYPINDTNFPPLPGSSDELSGLKKAVDKIHLCGLKAGLHTFTFAIDKDDPYVNPPHRSNLAKELPIRLASLIEPNDTVIHVYLSPEKKTEYDFFIKKGELNFLVENEILTVTRLSGSSSLYEMEVDRIEHSLHPVTATLYHLPEFYNKYLPEFISALCDEIADRIAYLVRELGIDFVYLDSHDGMKRIQPIEWYARNYATLAFYQRLPPEVLIQTSISTENYQWHMISRGNSDDRAFIGVKPYLDNHKIRGYVADYQKAFFAQELGWVGIQTSQHEDDAYTSTTLDELEVYLNRSLGFDLPIGFETEIAALRDNGITNQACELIKQYENLRTTGYFSQEILALLRQPGKEFHLIEGARGNFGFREQIFASHCVNEAAGENWTVKNTFQPQKLNFKITGLRKPDPYDSPNNIVLGAMEEVSEFSELTTSDPGCTCSVSTSTSAGGHTLQLTITNPSPNGWIELRKTFNPAVNLVRHKAIGVHVLSDRPVAVSVQLSSSASEDAVRRQYQFDVDSSGLVYQELIFPSTDELFRYYYGGYASLSRTLKRSLISFNYSKVGSLSIYVKNLPPGTTHITLGQIKALHQEDFILRNPTVQIGANGLTMLTDLNPGEYLKNEGTTVTKFDRRHQPVVAVPTSGSWPVLIKGNNSIRFRSNVSASTYSNKALLEVRMDGSPFFRGDYCVWHSPLEFLSPTNSHLILEKGNVGSGIRVKSSQAGDLQWLLMGLNLPSGTTIRGVMINYRCSTANSYISQVRLTSTKLPPTALVIHDDPADLKSTTAAIYQSVVANRITDGTITLELRLNYVNTTDSIDFGAIGLLLNG
ncbi:MAG: hypothetical protein HY835_09550 [Anaerolineae bacterium]|nr:hypothetical protein [Anaerolineae bacterium]